MMLTTITSILAATPAPSPVATSTQGVSLWIGVIAAAIGATGAILAQIASQFVLEVRDKRRFSWEQERKNIEDASAKIERLIEKRLTIFTDFLDQDQQLNYLLEEVYSVLKSETITPDERRSYFEGRRPEMLALRMECRRSGVSIRIMAPEVFDPAREVIRATLLTEMSLRLFYNFDNSSQRAIEQFASQKAFHSQAHRKLLTEVQKNLGNPEVQSSQLDT